MKPKIKLMPAIMTVLSAMYFFYVLQGQDTALEADTVGGDPGGKILPLTMAVFLFLGFLYITLKERPDGEKMHPVTKKLFLWTLLLSVGYVLLIRPVGFVILSAVLLYALEYLYTTIDETRNVKSALLGGTGVVALTVVLYFLMRTLTRTLMGLQRTGSLPQLFGSTAFQAVISMLVVALAGVLLKKTLYKKLVACGQHRIASAGLVTVVTVLLMFVIFKQFFNVNLAPGILNF